VHLQERIVGAIRSINEISNLQLLSLQTAKVVPALTYGLEIIWNHLTVKQLQSIESTSKESRASQSTHHPDWHMCWQERPSYFLHYVEMSATTDDGRKRGTPDQNRSRNSVVGIATSYGLDGRGVRVRVPVGSRIFSSPDRADRL
jgi:hypothetical protein